MTLSLVEFLRARLDEDAERQKNSLTAWHTRECASLPEEGQYSFACDCGVPERLLAETEADRALIREYEDSEASLAPAPDMWDVGRVEGLRVALAMRAAQYAEHEDFDESWRP